MATGILLIRPLLLNVPAAWSALFPPCFAVKLAHREAPPITQQIIKARLPSDVLRAPMSRVTADMRMHAAAIPGPSHPE
eukprot:734193-Pyramimonas_sp.AAC.1